jgi:S-adenosylmethionine:tRNA ribosyltransferase-isomerase
LQENDVVVLNDTKVIPARIIGHKKDTLGKVDALLCDRLSGRTFRALIKPNLRIGQEVIFGHGSVKAKLTKEKILEFNKELTHKLMERIGVMPLPPYIKRIPAKADEERYQTVYAKSPGAIASPTAGLHFTKKILQEIKDRSVNIASVTLHVGIGTFKPVKCPDVRQHIMEKEAFSVPARTVSAIRSAKEKGKRIFAVGTTTARALEAAAGIGHRSPVTSREGHTDLFIYPGYKFKVVDCLLTNFHLPKTTLFLLVCAFAGKDLIMRAYLEAIREKYRFYSYGDAMLII